MTNRPTDGAPVHDALAQHYDEFDVDERLHAVPPHETYAVTVDGRRAVCKLATGPRGDPATEAATMRFVARETPVPVPELLAVGPDHFVAEWRDDVPTDADFTGEKARAMGSSMARLHEATAGSFDGYGPVETADGRLAVDERDDWTAAVRRRLEDRRPYLETVDHADVADAVLDHLDDPPAALDDAGPPVLCHGNLLPDHVGTADGEARVVIDFEHAIVGPPAYDLWRTVTPIESGDDGSTRAAAFRTGYESVRPLPDGFDDEREFYRLVLAVEYLKSLYLQDQHDPETTREKADRYREFVFDRIGERGPEA